MPGGVTRTNASTHKYMRAHARTRARTSKHFQSTFACAPPHTTPPPQIPRPRRHRSQRVTRRDRPQISHARTITRTHSHSHSHTLSPTHTYTHTCTTHKLVHRHTRTAFDVKFKAQHKSRLIVGHETGVFVQKVQTQLFDSKVPSYLTPS